MHSEQLHTDSELLIKIKNNDTNALNILFKRYFSVLCYFSFQFVKSRDLTEEVVSDVFLNIWLKRGSIVIKSSLKAYLFTAVRNQSINYMKKKDYHFEELEIVDKEGKISSLRADDFLIYKDLENEIENIVQKLPEKRQLIFRMNRFEGLSYKEISEILSISINTIQNHMVKAVKFMSKQHAQLKKIISLIPFLTTFWL